VKRVLEDLAGDHFLIKWSRVITTMHKWLSQPIGLSNVGTLVLSTGFSHHDLALAKRTRKDGSTLELTCPKIIAEYTKRISGGEDL